MTDVIQKPLSFATSKQQRIDIKKAAKKAGQTVSAYCREAVLKRMESEQ